MNPGMLSVQNSSLFLLPSDQYECFMSPPRPSCPAMYLAFNSPYQSRRFRCVNPQNGIICNWAVQLPLSAGVLGDVPS